MMPTPRSGARTESLVAPAPVALGERLRRLPRGTITAGLAVSVVVAATVGAVAITVSWALEGRGVGNGAPALVQTFGIFFGFLAGGVFVGARAVRDRMLHAVTLAAAGFAFVAALTLIDALTGFAMSSMLPGSDLQDAANAHLGFWVVTWVAVPAATMLGASIVPRGGQDWGTSYSEPEDTEL